MAAGFFVQREDDLQTGRNVVRGTVDGEVFLREERDLLRDAFPFMREEVDGLLPRSFLPAIEFPQVENCRWTTRPPLTLRSRAGVRGLPDEYGCRKGVRMAVPAGYFAFGNMRVIGPPVPPPCAGARIPLLPGRPGLPGGSAIPATPPGRVPCRHWHTAIWRRRDF